MNEIITTKEHLSHKSGMKVKLSSCGNPDMQQNPNEPLYGCPSECYAYVATLRGASELCVIYINKWELGGGNWDGGQVFEGNKQIALVSYNGRIWGMNGEEIK